MCTCRCNVITLGWILPRRPPASMSHMLHEQQLFAPSSPSAPHHQFPTLQPSPSLILHDLRSDGALHGYAVPAARAPRVHWQQFLSADRLTPQSLSLKLWLYLRSMNIPNAQPHLARGTAFCYQEDLPLCVICCSFHKESLKGNPY